MAHSLLYTTQDIIYRDTRLQIIIPIWVSQNVAILEVRSRVILIFRQHKAHKWTRMYLMGRILSFDVKQVHTKILYWIFIMVT